MSEESRPVAQRHLKKVRKARAKRDAADREFHAAIVEAHQSGETFRDIGEWAGMSHQQIHNIVRGWQPEPG